MDYIGWVLSIYDEYKKQYKVKYPKINKKMSLKNILKLAYIIVIPVIGFIILYYSIQNKSLDGMFISTLMIFVAPLFVIYSVELTLEEYKKRLEIMKGILEKEGLYTSSHLEKLAKETGSVFYKIRYSNLEILIKSLTGIAGAIGITYLYDKITSEVFTIIFILSIGLIAIVYTLRSIIQLIPNSRIVRKKEFHELLIILVVYKMGNIDDSKSVLKESR